LTARVTVLTDHPLHKGGRRHDRDLAERIEGEQIAVARYDQISMAIDGQLEELIVSRNRGTPQYAR